MTLIVLLSSMAFAFAQTGPPTRVKTTPAVLDSVGGCQKQLATVVSSVESGLKQLDARRGAAYLGTVDELDQLLVKAGLGAGPAKAAHDRVRTLISGASDDPELSYLYQFVRDRIEDEHFFACVLAKTCSAASQRANHILYVPTSEHVIQIVSPITEDAREFAVNYVASYSNVAAEQILLTWERAVHTLERTRPGATDSIYREFASPGAGATRMTDIDQGFAMTFMALYYALQAQAMYGGYFPDRAARNANHLNLVQYRELTQGRNGYLTAPVVRRLGLTPTNVLSRARDLLHAMNYTMALAERR